MQIHLTEVRVVNPNLGMSDLEKEDSRSLQKRQRFKADFQAVVESDSPKIAMCNSDKVKPTSTSTMVDL